LYPSDYRRAHELTIRFAQGLIKCVKDGSAKQASKALTDAALKQTAKLLEYATSRSREKQSLLQRDLKLGVNHIDQGQLRRNGLLLPRYPTSILSLSAFVEDVVQSAEMKGVNNIFGTSVTVFRIKCSAKVAIIAADDELEGDFGYRSDSGVLGEIFQEEWIIYRTMKEFQTLHKHLKNEVSAAESSGTASSRLVGAATAAFAVTNAIQVPGRQRQKRILVPSLSQASKAGALGVTRKLNAKRKEILDNYLEYLLTPGHLIGHCTELLLFLGAFYPFPSHARVGVTLQGESDPLGRTEMLRTILKLRPNAVADNAMSIPASYQLMNRGTLPINCIQTAESNADDEEVIDEGDELDEHSVNKIDMIPSIKSKIERVHLSEVRNRLFELLRYQFGFENASFIRNRMLQALKTVSFAVAGPAEFRKMLYKAHLDYINADSIAGWIKKLSSILWPEGVFFSSAPPSTAEELKKQANEAKEALHSSFPAEVRAILGQDLTRDGMDILFEMLQNRMVLKSMAYMLFDLLWLEVFPELGDILTGGVALDIDSRAVN
jgi:Sorting nexin C terminal